MTAPTLSMRAAREQRVFRTLLNCMARPGLVGSIGSQPGDGRFGAAIALLECVLDHEVSFAVTPTEPTVVSALLRSTGSRSVSVDRADYILAWASGISVAIEEAKLGTFEYPERSGTVIVLVDEISATHSAGECLTLSGPGIRDSTDVWVTGFNSDLRDQLVARNAGAPIGIDAILIAPGGFLTCLPRYTRIVSFGV
ncbi:MAG: phosphonate C-P lyase system protein PhnH [Chloroflexota bacterium]